MPGRKLQILFVLILLAAAAFIIATRPSGEEKNRAAAFYHDLLKSLAPLPPADYRVYRDAGMYVPKSAGWIVSTRSAMLSYPYIQKSKFDVLLIRQSRVREDLNPIAQAFNHAALTRVREFYADVRDGTVDGYRLIYQTDYGLAFVSEALYQRFFVSANDAAADEWPACRSCQPGK